MAIPRAFVTNVAVCELPIDQPTTRLENVSFGNSAIYFAFTGGMFREVCDPQLVRLVAGEFTVDEIADGRGLMLGTRTFVSRKSFHTSSSHQHFDAAVSHGNTVTKGEFSVDAPGTVGAMRGGVNLGDQLPQPGMTQ